MQVPISLSWPRKDVEAGEVAAPRASSTATARTRPRSTRRFSVAPALTVERGVVFAVRPRSWGWRARPARWYDDGKLLHKPNTFTDFVACAPRLADVSNCTTPELLAAEGRSAGGLLMESGFANLAPGLFRAIVAEVPFVDVVSHDIGASRRLPN